ncbi:hypothetical protein LSH36_364g02050 [Paralvinella palmiformis]|uniref:Fe2OG dioxygenase domain-containing protein n=1 Tax=Paralvinella palmiformis TaxID=53620 RepID=A0AAD9JE04_9ANNE|nr:hypothetical protein LSH36_364g02050 [Paralvinella palmiformis]
MVILSSVIDNKKSDDVMPTDSTRSVISYRRIIIRFILVISVMVSLNLYASWQGDDVFADSKDTVEKRVRTVSCSDDYVKEREKFPVCVPKWCGRIVMDNIVSKTEAQQLLRMAKAGLGLGGSHGGASILDIHSGALSKGDKFVDVFRTVKDKIHTAIAGAFGISKDSLYLTSPTFFSRMTSKPARTIHDEYWHIHVDKETYGSFHYTSLLYLTTYNQDFTGGRFVFVDKGRNTTVEPKLGRVSFFTSGWENPHFVEKVRSGTRYAITVSFTCDPDKAIGDPTMR